MKKIICISLLSILITIIGYQKAESNSNKNISKKKSNYVILNIEGLEYGRFGMKDGAPFVTKGRGKTAAIIGLGSNGFAITLFDGDVTATRGTIMYLFLKNATGIGKYSFDGLTISGYDGSGTKLNYRTDVGDINHFFYDTDEKIIRTKPGGSRSCNIKSSGIFGKTEVVITQFTRNAANPNGIIEGTFTARINGNSVKDVDDCLSDQGLNITGYFYMNN
jgi:hypothetical protein